MRRQGQDAQAAENKSGGFGILADFGNQIGRMGYSS